MVREFELTCMSARETAAHVMRAVCSAYQNRDSVGRFLIACHFPERAGAVVNIRTLRPHQELDVWLQILCRAGFVQEMHSVLHTSDCHV